MALTPNPEPPLGLTPKRSGPRWLMWAGVLLLIAIGVPLALLGWLLMQYPHRPGPGTGRVVQVEIAPGAQLDTVARQLKAVGALRQPEWFAWHARLRGAQGRLRSGVVMLYDNMRPRELLQRIAHGYGSAELRIVVPEGVTRFDIARKLERWGVCSSAAFVAASEDAELMRELQIEAGSAEGWLFPDTYRLQEEMDARLLVQRFVANGRRRAADLFTQGAAQLERLGSELGWGPREIVTLASIVEKEAKSRDEQAVIAGVFLNRMREPTFRPKRLQADPTVAYGCLVAQAVAPSCVEFDGLHVTRGMLLDPRNPYNTYRLDGLPPGPISNPGLSAISAVLMPASHDYFYFVAKGGGVHQFSHSLQDHNSAVEQQRGR